MIMNHNGFEQTKQAEQNQPPPPPLLTEEPPPLAWENPAVGPSAFFLTLWEIVSRPKQALATPARAGWPRAALFALLCWLLVFAARYLAFRLWAMGPSPGLGVMLMALLGMLLQAAVFMPLYSGAVFFTLRMLRKGGPVPPYTLVLRAVCYTQVTTVALLLPMLGLVAHVVWNVVLMMQALNLGLGVSRRHALQAVVLPMAGFFLLGLLFSWLAMGG